MRTRSHTVVLFCLSLCLLISLNACSSDDLSSPQHNTGVKIEEDVLAPPTLVSLRLEPAKPLPWRPVACLYQVKVPKGAEDVSAHQWYVDDQPVAAGAGGKLSADAFGPGAEVRCQVDPATKTGATAETTSVQARALGARMIKDLETQGADTGTAVLAHLGDTVLIQVWMNQQPLALWGAREDGTDPQVLRTFESGWPTYVVSANLLFFIKKNKQGADELWRSDGTAKGTSLLKQWLPLEEGSSRVLYAFGQDRVLVMTRSPKGDALGSWVSDGSKEGTTPLQGLAPETLLDSYLRPVLSQEGSLYLLAWSSMKRSLWRIDGRSARLSRVADLEALTANGWGIRAFWVLGQRIVLVAADRFGSQEKLWAIESLNAGEPVLMESFEKEPAGNFGVQLSFQLGDSLLFWKNAPNTPASLWATTATKGAGARELLRSSTFGLPYGFSQPSGVIVDQLMYFWEKATPASAPSSAEQWALWRSDGTPEGTFALFRHPQAQPAPTELAKVLIPWQGKLYFIGQDASTGAELWLTDGTLQGTTLAMDTLPAPSGLWTATDRHLYYVGEDEALWKTDGTMGGTSQVLGKGHGVELTDVRPFVADDKVFFSRETLEHGRELWVTDGSKEGTQIVKDINLRTRDLQASSSSLVDGELYLKLPMFPASVWRHRGEDLIEIKPGEGVNDDLQFDIYAVLRDTLILKAYSEQDATKASFWTLTKQDDRVSPATNLPEVEDLQSFSFWSLGQNGDCMETHPMGRYWHRGGPEEPWKEVSLLPTGQDLESQPFLAVNTMLFSRRDEAAEMDVLLASGCDGSPARELARVERARYNHYFSYSTPKHHYFFNLKPETVELWRTDGTAQGTQKVAPVIVIVKGTEDYRPVGHAGDDFYFGTIVPSDPPKSIYEDGERQLWVVKGSDPTPIKLGVFQDIWGLGEGSAVGNVVYFGADDGIHGAELWRSDGTAKGTRMVRDMVPGPQGARPNGAKVFLGLLWFSATTAAGSELWVSDGTQEGTLLFQDIYPGAPSSTPSLMLGDEQRLYFLADDGIHGREWWVME